MVKQNSAQINFEDKKFWVKISGSKKLRSKKIVGPKKRLGQNMFGPKRKGPPKNWVKNVWSKSGQ